MILGFALLSAALSFCLAIYIRRYSLKNKIGLQSPRENRDIHAKPTSRLGGVAIVVSFVVVMILVAAFAHEGGPFGAGRSSSDFGFPYAIFGISIDKRLLGILLATVFLSIVMLRDDIKGVAPYWKLLAQIGAALLLILTGVGITYLNNPFGLTIALDSIKIPIQLGANIFHFVLWADLFLIFWVVLLTNATNFIDGLDGLATSLSAIAAIILVFLSLKEGQLATALMAAVFAGAIIGLLPLNLPLNAPRSLGGGGAAKIFLGDTGSMFLGLMLAILTVISGGKLATVLLVFGLVIIDALYVVTKRVLRGKNPLTTPDQSHLHHRFLRAGFTPTMSLIAITLLSLSFGLAGLLTGGKIKIILIAILVLFSILMFVLLDSVGKKGNSKMTS